MKLPVPSERPHPAVTAASVAAAYAAFGAVFRGPRPRFWQRMTCTGLGLGALALASSGELRRARPRPRDVGSGVAIAAGLYAVFQVGDRVARRIMPSGAEDIGDVYLLRSLRPKAEIAARLAAVIGPAEELYWRGMLQAELSAGSGRWPGRRPRRRSTAARTS